MPNLSDDLFASRQFTPNAPALVLPDGSAVPVLVTSGDPSPNGDLGPSQTLLSQFTPTPPVPISSDGTPLNLSANVAVLTPYSLVTPPGVTVVG